MIPTMPDTAAFHIRETRWDRDGDLLRQVRRAVFIEEQGIPEALEWDDQDPVAQHLLAMHRDGRPLGTARLLADGRIGRMAVLAEWRGRGVGRALLNAAVAAAARRGLAEVFLHAQLSAEPFYLRCGFRPEGEVFEEAGIPHRALRMPVQ